MISIHYISGALASVGVLGLEVPYGQARGSTPAELLKPD